jgi:hypothetical protein
MITRKNQLTRTGLRKVSFVTDAGLRATANEPRINLGSGGKTCPIWVSFPTGHPRRGDAIALTVEEAQQLIISLTLATGTAEALAQ